ncbi:MAG: ComF family protein [Actinomycetota bacterium]
MLRAILDEVLDGLFASSCAACSARARPLCEGCRAQLRAPPSAPPPPGVDWWVAAFAYAGPGRELVARTKYRNGRAAIPWLAAAVSAACPPSLDIDVVTWAPASRTRRRDQGLDHAFALARGVARRLDVPVAALLARADTRAQTGSSWLERRRGPDLRATGSARHLRVLLVDDVATTGATVAAAASALLTAGAASVAVATAARTPRRNRL